MHVQGTWPLVLECGNEGDLQRKTKMKSQSYSKDKREDNKGETNGERGHT